MDERLENPIDEAGFEHTLDLGPHFLRELTTSGSFDIRGEIWSTTFGKVISCLPIPAALIDEWGDVWTLNEAWGRLLRHYKKLQNTPFADLMAHPVGKERMACLLQEVLAERRPQVTEGKLTVGDSTVWARMTFRSVRLMGGRFVLALLENLTGEKVQLEKNRRLQLCLERLVAKRTDQLRRKNDQLKREILAHKKTLRALEDSERRYRCVVEDQTDMIFRFLPDGTLVFVNPACAHFVGRTPEEICSETAFDIMPGIFGCTLKEVLTELSEKNRTVEFEHLLTNADDQPRWTIWTVRAIIEEKRRVTAFQGVGRDITERKLAADRLYKSEELLRAVFNSTEDIVVVKDRDLRITHWNPALEHFLGLDGSQIAGRRDEEFLDPEFAARSTERDKRVLDGKMAVEVETTVPIRGTSVTLLEAKTPLLSPQGEVIGVVTICKDITSRKPRRNPKVLADEPFPSTAMQSTVQRARIAANSDSNLLLQGETGTGKDFLARWIHDKSARSAFSYQAVNCAALPPALAESELFGHERGAFTGAVVAKKGLVEISEGGTLLLNEIGELPLELQAKLLVFLDTRSFLRVGGSREISVNVRVIAATHRDLRAEMAAGRFLEPLYYRLNVLKIEIPPLRERLDDLTILVERLYGQLTSKMPPSEVPEIQMVSIRNLKKYQWPGNVRELKNLLERALIMAQGNVIILKAPADDTAVEDVKPPRADVYDGTLKAGLEEFTKRMCEDALLRADGNRAQAARKLGISRGTLYRIIHQSGLE